jgi:3-dehydroquinate synthase
MDGTVPAVVLPPGESGKDWAAVETILRAAQKQGLGRDGLFIGAGGGVVCDLTAFAASVYMRGAGLVLVPTTLLSMVDASVGGKTGFDFGGIKNLAGTFYPARGIVIAADSLKTLPEKEWKSGMAELIKTAVLDEDPCFFERLKKLPRGIKDPGSFAPFIEEALRVKGRIVERDPRETGTERVLLNLGHTFGHALEASLGLGTISHGEAVAWGIARSCELGMELGLTPPERGEAIFAVLQDWGYETKVPPLPLDPSLFRSALFSDKKKKNGMLRFVVPGVEGARLAGWNTQVERYLEKLVSKISLLS